MVEDLKKTLTKKLLKKITKSITNRCKKSKNYTHTHTHTHTHKIIIKKLRKSSTEISQVVYPPSDEMIKIF